MKTATSLYIFANIFFYVVHLKPVCKRLINGLSHSQETTSAIIQLGITEYLLTQQPPIMALDRSRGKLQPNTNRSLKVS